MSGNLRFAGILMLLMFTGCPREPVVGGGDRRITGISILAREHGTLLKEKNPATLRVGERLPLRVVASWAIPYVGEVTDKAKFAVSDNTVGDLDAQAVFTARKPGSVAIEAVLRVANRAGGHEPVGPEETAGSDPIVEFRDRIELTVIE